MEEEVGIVLHSSTGGTVIIYVVGEPSCSFSSGQSSTDDSSSEGLDNWWQLLGFLGSREDLICLWKNASRTLLGKLDGVLCS